MTRSEEKSYSFLFVLFLFCVMLTVTAYPASDQMPILDYIKKTWRVLTRSNKDLAAAALDPKAQALPDGRRPVYVAPGEDVSAIERHLKRDMPSAEFQKIELRPLPSASDLAQIRVHGLLYLPRSYVVPGGRFNEMYGWDSFFIQMGLLRDGELNRI